MARARGRRADAERQPMPPLPGESSERGPALGQVVRRGHRRAVSGPRAPAPMAKGRVHHRAPPARLAHREGEIRSEEHTSELQSHLNLVCRLLLEKKNKS